jgi:hypothetical protein
MPVRWTAAMPISVRAAANSAFASSPYCSLVYPYAVGGRHRKGHGAAVEPENILRIQVPRSILMLSKLQSRTKCATAVLVLPLIKMLYFDFILVAFMVQETRMIANRVLLTERHIALAISGTE